MDELKAKKILENKAVFALKLPGDNTMVTILVFQGHFSSHFSGLIWLVRLTWFVFVSLTWNLMSENPKFNTKQWGEEIRLTLLTFLLFKLLVSVATVRHTLAHYIQNTDMSNEQLYLDIQVVLCVFTCLANKVYLHSSSSSEKLNSEALKCILIYCAIFTGGLSLWRHDI